MDISFLLIASLTALAGFILLVKVFSRKGESTGPQTTTPADPQKQASEQADPSLEIPDDDFQDNDPNDQAAVKNKVPPLYQLPGVSGKFMGRKADLEEMLRNADQAGIILAGQNGLEGAGKTTLALKAAGRLAAKFPDGQIFLRMRGDTPHPMPPEEAMCRTIWAYYPKMRLAYNEELRKIYRSLLKEKKILFILDNAKDLEQVTPLTPALGNCFFLITTREPFSLPSFYTQVVAPLEMKPAHKLLESIAVKPGVMTDEISKLCDYLPLPLCIIGGFLAYTRNFTPLQVSGKIQSKRKMLEQMSFSKENKCLEAAFKVSYGNLKSSLTSVLCRLAIFPATFEAKAEEHICDDFNRGHLKRLEALHLVVHDERNGRYWLHSEIRRFAAGYLGKGDMASTQKLHAKYYLKVLEKASRLFTRENKAKAQAGLSLFDVEWDNIQAGQAWAGENLSMDKDAPGIACAFARWGADFLPFRLPHTESIQWHDTALSAARRMNDQKTEMEQLTRMGYILLEARDFRQAMEHLNSARELSRNLREAQQETGLLVALGRCYLELEIPLKATAFFEQALDNKPSDPALEKTALDCLGATFRSLGNHKKAVGFYEKAVSVARQMGDRLSEANSLWSISQALEGMEEREQAVQHAEAALKAFPNSKHPNAKKARAQLKKWQGTTAEHTEISVVKGEEEISS